MASYAAHAASRVPDHEEIDRVHAHAISVLLAQPSPESIMSYYSSLTESGRGPGLKVKNIGSDMGKGLFSERFFEVDELVLKDSMLVGAQHTHNKTDALVCSFCFCHIGSIELQIGRRLYAKDEEGLEHRDSPIKEVIDGILCGDLHLPYTHLFQLPPVVKCVGGCSEELFCSQACAEAAWESHHCLLCTGSASLCKNQDSLIKFKHHADETNDIFHVAAQVLSSTILRASKLKSQSNDVEKIEDAQRSPENRDVAALFKAWEPFAMGYKRLWWDSVALPVDLDASDEPDFRSQLRELAASSLSLLKEAIFQDEYGPVFSLQVYGCIIGMFELNNLDLVVASPVEDYFIYIDDLSPSEKAEAQKVTGPLLDALGDEYATSCEGTAFFPIQSCINHSCCPNAKAFKRDEDKDGQAVLLAIRPIKKGEQVTISYIDETSPWEVRKVMLEDYGFICKCSRCLEERSFCSDQ